jgi:indolepyruvate ferredoxin oxidoreductase
MVTAGGGYRILSPGIGGTGVVTINALLATAASIEGLFVITLDQTGLAQKGGAVVSHLLVSESAVAAPSKINTANADLVLGFDLVTLTHPDNFRCLGKSRTAAVLNTTLAPTGETIRKRRVLGDLEQRLGQIEAATDRGSNVYVDATRFAESLFGTHMLSNMFLLGTAWQAGLIPLRRESIEAAIRLNAVEVDRNLLAFAYGRACYADPSGVESLVTLSTERDGTVQSAHWGLPLSPARQRQPGLPKASLAESRPDWAAELTAYQNAAYARRFTEAVERVRREAPELADTVARNLYKLMAYKDEYEVGRLLTSASFRAEIGAQFESVEKLEFLLHPPLLRRLGLKRKIAIGRWPLRLLASLKWLRGTPLDPFGWTTHRRRERQLIGWYLELIDQALPLPVDIAKEILDLPEMIRGFEHIKERSIDQVQQLAKAKLASATALQARTLQ